MMVSVALGSIVSIAGAAQDPVRIEVSHVRGSVYRLYGAVDVIVASIGRDGVLLVDGGYPETLTAVKRVLDSLGAGRPPRVLVNTHWHHTFANAGFGDSTTIVAHRSVRDRMRRPNDMAGRLIPPSDSTGLPDVVFSDSLVLHFNGERITLLHLPAAHTDGDILVRFEGSNVVATGDAFVPHLPWIDRAAGGRLAGLRAGIATLMRTVPSDAVVVPGHGPNGTYADIGKFGEMIRDTELRVRSAVAQGRSAGAIDSAGVSPEWESWEAAIPAAFFVRTVREAIETEPLPRTIELRGGRWLRDGAFHTETWYAAAGKLTRRRPAVVDTVIDLEGGYAMPAFGDAHIHALSDSATVGVESAAWLASGVFNTMVQDPIHEVGPMVLRQVNRPDAVDAAYTHGVVTPRWSVIAKLYDTLAESGAFPGIRTVEDADGRNIFLVDGVAELARKWDAIVARNRDFLKVIVAFSEEQALRRGNPAYDASPPRYSKKAGLDPTVLRELVRRAHRDGLRVSAHIETAADFRLAVSAGADIVAHLPGAWQIGPETGFADSVLTRWKLTDADAREAARRGVVVITTAARPATDPRARMWAEVHRHNLAALTRHDVPLAIGTDGAAGGVIEEALFLERVGGVNRAVVIDALTHGVARAAFPGRAIGRIEEGNEASFVVLARNPLDDLRNLARITLGVKQGTLVERGPGRR